MAIEEALRGSCLITREQASFPELWKDEELRREIAAGLSQARAEQFSSRAVMQIADSVLEEPDDEEPGPHGGPA